MDLDVSCFKAFKAASETLNFTEAARQVGMTQSGVSQHIAQLEIDLGTVLFLRIGKKVVLTEEGKTLLQFIEEYQDQVMELKEKIQENSLSLKGRVSYAMPETCLLSPHFNYFLSERKKLYPELELIVDIDASEEVIKKVMNAQIDFGFVTKKILNDELDYQFFCEEEYVLVSAADHKIKDLKEESWIQWPGSEVLLDVWLNHQKSRRVVIKITGRTNSLYAAFAMVAQNLGVMVVPRHSVESSALKSQLKVHSFNKRPCFNPISIVSLKNGHRSQRVNKTIETFMQIKNK